MKPEYVITYVGKFTDEKLLEIMAEFSHRLMNDVVDNANKT
jgi:hypothetical protein